MPKEVRGTLFEPFISNKGQRGTGLGLAVTRKIVEQHGGSILVDDSVSPGAALVIRIPTDHADDDSDRTRAPQAIPEADLDIEF